MYTDLPQLARCCFCAPLRIGLLVWGYIKLIISLFNWLTIGDGIYQCIIYGYIPPTLIIYLVVVAIDMPLNIILIIAAHKKHERLFNAYYIYSIVLLVLVTIGCTLLLIYMIVLTVVYPHPYLVRTMLMVFVGAISSILIQVYIVLLVRSELFKLRDRTSYQFTNQAEEAQCNAYEEKV